MFPATKFRPPTPGPNVIARPELFDQRSGARPAVVVVRAPAGYGKTTAAALWAEGGSLADGDPRAHGFGGHRPARCIWVSLDVDDDDPAGLWAAITAAAAGAGLWSGRVPEASGVGGARAGAIVPLIDAFAATDADWVLVLDDAHRLTHEDTVASLDWFVGRAPENLTTIVATRTPLALPAVDRFLARGRAIEVGVEELRLDDRQAAVLLRDAHGLELTASDVAHVVEVTGGWPAAVSLVGSALARGVPLAGIGAHRPDDGGLDALVREGLAGSSRQDHALLLSLSVFERFDAVTVQEVVQDDRAWPLAMEVAARTGLVATLDDEGRWWRLHHLVRDRLAAELQREDPLLRRELHRRAFAVFEREHDLVATIHHLLGADDYDTIADILANVRSTTIVPRQSLGLSWLDRIPESALDRDPRLAFYEAWATSTAGDATRRDRALARGRLAAVGRAVEGFRNWDDVEDFVHSMACFGDVGTAHRAGQRFLASYDASSPLMPLVAMRTASMRYLEGRCTEALELLDDVERAGPLARPLRLFVPAYRALCLFELDDRVAAAEQVERSVRARAAYKIGPDPVYLPAEQALARHRTESGDAVAGRAIAAGALETARQQGDSVLVVPHLLIELARAELALGRAAEAVVSLNRAEELCVGFSDPGALPARIRQVRERSKTRRSAAGNREALSRRELEVLTLLPSALSAAEIGSELFVSTNTVRSHVKSIHRKLGVTTRTEAVAAARRAGLIA
ncbi:LuxR C-terminal-related transcriptional regulator [Agromyces sp. H3Y2-19a]|uniref:LuxR C-terminal-related transcriptional regulator n=1 Tax=Agromyces chromiiresistens TaxID=3030835 RepID=UPI0023B9631D|nr:LuxR C-terminal-related transcriptional regulator [Agromyces chromiiresistens]MDF0512250.1 LuxR C-terminal-related transcriptional regulator [Agromyces chromiiresistens]